MTEASGGNFSARSLREVLGVIALLVAIMFGLWRVDEHFVTHAEFDALRADVTAIREHMGIALPPVPNGRP